MQGDLNTIPDRAFLSLSLCLSLSLFFLVFKDHYQMILSAVIYYEGFVLDIPPVFRSVAGCFEGSLQLVV